MVTLSCLLKKWKVMQIRFIRLWFNFIWEPLIIWLYSGIYIIKYESFIFRHKRSRLEMTINAIKIKTSSISISIWKTWKNQEDKFFSRLIWNDDSQFLKFKNCKTRIVILILLLLNLAQHNFSFVWMMMCRQ